MLQLPACMPRRPVAADPQRPITVGCFIVLLSSIVSVPKLTSIRRNHRDCILAATHHRLQAHARIDTDLFLLQVTPVRNAAKDAMEAIINNMSGHATAFVLPMLYEAMLSTKWMTKLGALQLLSVLSKTHSRQVCMPGMIPSCCRLASSSCCAGQVVTWANGPAATSAASPAQRSCCSSMLPSAQPPCMILLP